MKTKFSLFIFLFGLMLFASCSSTPQKKTDWDDFWLKGKVQTLYVKEYQAEMAFGELTKGLLVDSTIISFSEKGEITQSVRYHFNDDRQSVISKSIFIYSDNTKTEDRFVEDSLTQKQITIYTDWGAIEKETTYDAAGKITRKEEYTYNNKHEIEEKNVYDNEGLWRKWKDYEYNDKGLVKKVRKYNNKGKLSEVEYFKYDDQGREIKSKAEDEDGVVQHTITYTYNKEGLQSSFTYDCKYFNHKYEYSYEYDKMGSYILARNFGPDVNSIQERTIKYY